MAEPYVGEIILFAGTFVPQGYLACDGSTQSINTYPNLFSFIGTTYGGDGQTTFKLPDLRGQVPVHVGRSSPSGNSNNLGAGGGTETASLTTTTMPAHSHFAQCSTAAGDVASPAGNVFAVTNSRTGPAPLLYTSSDADQPMAATTGVAGGALPFSRVQPYLGIMYVIATDGIYPSSS